MKKLTTTTLALTLASTMALSASATAGTTDLDEQVFNTTEPSYSATYETVLSLNGKALDPSALPNADGIPMRLVAESDYGTAIWYEEMNESYFYFGNYIITVSFDTGTVYLNGEELEDMTVELIDGVTYLPYDIMNHMEGYSAQLVQDGSDLVVAISTPNGSLIAQMALTIADAADMAMGMTATEDELAIFGVDVSSLDAWYGIFPMMVNPDTIIVGKLAEDADVDFLQEQWETYCSVQADTFTWYLPDNLPRVEDARFEVHNGYVLCLISENAQAGVDAFYQIMDMFG